MDAPLNDTGVSVKGYQILIEIPELDNKRGNIYLPESMLANEKAGSCIGRVLELGPESFLDEEKFPAGKRCEAGDYIIMSAYSGVRFNLSNAETRKKRDLRLIEDTAVLATVPYANHLVRA